MEGGFTGYKSDFTFSGYKSEKVKAGIWDFVAFSNISSETFVPSLVSLTRPSLQILGKTQTGIFLTFRFLVNPL